MESSKLWCRTLLRVTFLQEQYSSYTKHHLSFAILFKVSLDRVCPGRCIRRRKTSIPWFPRFSDFSPVDFDLLWSCRRKCLSRKAQRHELLSGKTVRHAQSVTKGILANTWRETAHRLEVCRDTNEAHTEIYCVYNKFDDVKCLNIYEFLIFT